jgi:hypothetical protein
MTLTEEQVKKIRGLVLTIISSTETDAVKLDKIVEAINSTLEEKTEEVA